MNKKGSFRGTGNIESELMDSIDNDEIAKMQKNRYKTGVRAGLAVIFIATAVFVYFMLAMPPEPSPIYLAGCGLSALLMIASIAVVSVRLKRLQAGYFGSAQAAVQDFSDEMARRIKNGDI